MNYLTLGDVSAAAPQLRLSSTSRPTDVRVTEIIAQVSAEMDIRLKNLGFQTPIDPVTAPLSYKIVQSIIIKEVLAQVLEEQYAGVSNPDNYGAQRFHDQFIEKIKSLVNPNDPFTLPDAISINVQEKLVGETGGISAMIGIDDDDYRMTRGMEF